MDDRRPEAAARVRQSFDLSDEARWRIAGEPQRLARQAIRSQAAAREYVERQLVRTQQKIQNLQAKFRAVWREKAIAVEAARAARDAEAHAERNHRAAAAALINEKSVSHRAQQDAREARQIIRDLRAQLALADQTAESLQTQLTRERQARTAAEQTQTVASTPVAVTESPTPSGQLVKRKRGRPPGKRDTPSPRLTPKAPQTYATDQEPVQWWPDGWTPRA